MDSPAPSTLPSGTPALIGNCQILEKLGQGGMGAVYRARHQTLDRVIALKLLPHEFTQSQEYVQRFLREARAAAQLKHPHVVQVYDAGEQGGQYYISMEFVDGTSLAGWLKRHRVMQETDGLKLMAQAAQGLAAAHAQGLVHRDIKPENLLLGRDGLLKIADFGLVTGGQGDSALTRSGAMLGTPTYMSPEQCEGETAGARSDLYSLGATFFRLLTGSAPFSAPTPIGLLFKHKYEAPPDPRAINPAITEGAAHLLLKLMAKRPEDRFASAGEVIAALEALLQGVPLGFSPSTFVPVPPGSSPAVVSGGSGGPFATPTPLAGGSFTPAPAPGLTPAQTPTLLPGTFTPLPSGGSLPPTLLVGGQPTPVPGTTFHGQFVAPPAKKGSRLAWAAAILVLLGAGGVFGYLKYHESQIQQAKTQAEDRRALKQYAEAIQILEAACARYPGEADLKSRRDGIEAEFLNQRIVRLKEQAREALESAKPQDALAACTQALDLAGRGASLPGFELDPQLPALKKRAEDLRDFQQFMEQGQTAEKAGRHDEAAQAFEQAQGFEAKPGREAATALTRATFHGLLAAAERQEKIGSLAGALETARQAAALKAGDVSALQERLTKKIQFEKLLAEARAEMTAGRLREAAARLEKAAALAEAESAGEALRTQARDLVLDADYGAQMAKGDAALAAARWSPAQEAYRAALKLKPQEPLPTQKLEQAILRELAAQAAAAVQAGDAGQALELYRKALARAPGNEEFRTKASELEGRLARIETCEKEARAAEAQSDWEKAQIRWNELATLDPSRKAACDARAQNARFELGMAKARASLQAGRMEDALAHARLAATHDSSGGQRAQVLIAEIQNKTAAREASANAGRAVEQAVGLVREGKRGAALGLLSGAARGDPGNAELASLKASLEALDALEKSYTRLQQIREDAQASIQTALAADSDDKKVKAMLETVKGYEPKIAEPPKSLRQAWLERNFEKLAAASAPLQGLARELAQELNAMVAEFQAKAASAAKPKANIGGLIGGFGRGRVGGSVGASGDIGANSKLAAIYDATAQSLIRCVDEARRLGASE